MLIIREVFNAKPGMASKLAKLMVEVGRPSAGKVSVMTDVAGEFNQVVVEYEVESLGAFENAFAEYQAKIPAEVKAKMAGYTEMYTKGRREIYRLQ